MNLGLDALIRRVVAEPDVVRTADADDLAAQAGVSLADTRAVLVGDLGGLYTRGAHPLLLMQLAGALGVDPIERLNDAQEKS